MTGSAALAPASGHTAASNGAADAIARVADAFAHTWDRHDMQAFAELYAQDADFVNVFGVWWHGREEIRSAHEATHRSLFAHSRLVLQAHSIRLLTADVAVCRTPWRLVDEVDRAGRPLPARSGKLLHVLQCVNGDWRIVATQNTNDTPMP